MATFNANIDPADGYTYAAAVTPSDATDLPFTTRAIYVGGTGAITLTMEAGGDVVFSAVPVGTVLRVKATRIKATGTTATLMVALS